MTRRRRPTWLLLAATPLLLAASEPIVAWRYIVQPGDTLATVAARMGVSPGDLARANALSLDARPSPGTVLQRPDPNGMPREHAPLRPASPRPAARIAPPPRAVPPPRPAPEPAPGRRPEPGTPHLAWPTSGAVVNRFGAMVRGQPDNGIDLAAFAGMTVRAAAPGRVIFAGNEPQRFGQLIIIDHGGGWATAYAYLGKVLVKEGARVRAGLVIARIGASGEARKPTLHFELRRDNTPHDPLPALPIRL